MQVEKAANHYWNSTLRPVNIGILIRFSCLFGSFDMVTDDTCFVFNLISDVTLATVDDEISLTLKPDQGICFFAELLRFFLLVFV